MNRVRIRIGRRIKEYTLESHEGENLHTIEAAIGKRLQGDYTLGKFTGEYLGNFAWDLLIDGVKCGHAKAWKDPDGNKKQTGRQLWSWFLLFVGALAALC